MSAPDSRFVRACKALPGDRTPVWFMRQAGRYMREYRAVRKSHSLIEICKNPQLAAEVTITAEGVYWHPVGAEDADLLVTQEIFPLAESFAAVRRAFDRESEHPNKLARIFNCA